MCFDWWVSVTCYLWELVFSLLNLLNFFFLGEDSMGTASSLLTQYDIEGVQQHCHNLCNVVFSISCFSVSLLMLFWCFSSQFLFLFIVFEKLSLPARNSVTVSNVLSARSKCKGVYLSWWILISAWVCNESTLSSNLFGPSVY